jgi:hypothetical protein
MRLQVAKTISASDRFQQDVGILLELYQKHVAVFSPLEGEIRLSQKTEPNPPLYYKKYTLSLIFSFDKFLLTKRRSIEYNKQNL